MLFIKQFWNIYLLYDWLHRDIYKYWFTKNVYRSMFTNLHWVYLKGTVRNKIPYNKTSNSVYCLCNALNIYVKTAPLITWAWNVIHRISIAKCFWIVFMLKVWCLSNQSFSHKPLICNVIIIFKHTLCKIYSCDYIIFLLCFSIISWYIIPWIWPILRCPLP